MSDNRIAVGRRALRNTRRLFLEQLEQRLALAAVLWRDAVNGAFDDANKWDCLGLPCVPANDRIYFNEQGTYSILFDGNTTQEGLFAIGGEVELWLDHHNLTTGAGVVGAAPGNADGIAPLSSAILNVIDGMWELNGSLRIGDSSHSGHLIVQEAVPTDLHSSLSVAGTTTVGEVNTNGYSGRLELLGDANDNTVNSHSFVGDLQVGHGVAEFVDVNVSIGDLDVGSNGGAPGVFGVGNVLVSHSVISAGPVSVVDIGPTQRSSGTVRIEEGSDATLFDSRLGVGPNSSGVLEIDGAETEVLFFGDIEVGIDGRGKVVVTNHASVTVHSIFLNGTKTFQFPVSGWLDVASGATVDFSNDFRLAVAGATNAGAQINVTGGGKIVWGGTGLGRFDVAADGIGKVYLSSNASGTGTIDVKDVFVGVGDGEGLIDIDGGILRSQTGKIASGEDVSTGVEGRVKLHGSASGKWTATGDISVGSSSDLGPGNVPSPGFLQVDAGVVEANAVHVYKTGTLSGKTRVKVPGDKIDVQGGKVAAGASGGEGTVAVFTFEGGFDSTSGGTVLADIQGPVYDQDYDTLYVTESSSLGGTLEVSVNGYQIIPWNAAAGDYFMVLRSVSSLTGEFLHGLPPADSVVSGAPSPDKHFSWKAVYDRTDTFDSTLVNDYGDAFLNQPWVGNGTKDVVLLIVEVDNYDPPPGHNDPPDSSPDSYPGEEDNPIQETDPGVLGNDMDPNGDILTSILVDGPNNGTLTLNPGGGFIYTPNLGFWGIDSFTYRASDGQFLSPETTVTLTVDPGTGGGCSGGSPIAVDDLYVAVPSVMDNVLANDTDPSGIPSQAVVTLVSGPTHAVSFELLANGDFNYTMESEYFGQDSFTYQFDACGQTSNVATVTLDSMAQPLMLDQPPAIVRGDSPSITQADLDRLAREAARRWVLAGVDRISVHRAFHATRFEVADLSGSTLGLEASGRILIDVNAAGFGWFVDATPRTDDEFSLVVSRSERQAARGSAAYGRADLLTALMHEFGHVLGMVHLEGDEFAHSVMNDTLGLSMRRVPRAADIMASDEYFAELWLSGSTIKRRRW